MTSEKTLTVPMSRYKRELNSLSRKLAKGDIDVIRVSVNKVDKLVCISPKRYRLLTEQLCQIKIL